MTLDTRHFADLTGNVRSSSIFDLSQGATPGQKRKSPVTFRFDERSVLRALKKKRRGVRACGVGMVNVNKASGVKKGRLAYDLRVGLAVARVD